MIQTINTSLLNATTKYIAHQCNCITPHSAGLAKSIFDRFPYSNTYKLREDGIRSSQGTIDVLGNGDSERYIINMYIQYYPGKPYLRNTYDSYSKRLEYFKKCLAKITKIPNLESIGFAKGMGCKLAGGNEQDYSKILEEFSGMVSLMNVKVFWYNYDTTLNSQMELTS